MTRRNRTDPGTHSSAPDAAAGARSSATHDPLCPSTRCTTWREDWGYDSGPNCHCGSWQHRCQCDLIAKVRADQLERDICKLRAAYGPDHRDSWNVEVLYDWEAIDALRGES